MEAQRMYQRLAGSGKGGGPLRHARGWRPCALQLMAVAALIMGPASVCVAGGLQEQQQVRIPSQSGGNVEPLSVQAAKDGALLLSGSDGRNGWVAKYARDGARIWSFTSTLAPSGNPHDHGEYRAVAVAPDGSHFACGNKPAENGGTVVMLARLAPTGQLLSEKVVLAGSVADRALYYVSDCLFSDGALILVGMMSDAMPPTALGMRKRYWFAHFDAEGRQQWKVLIPAKDEHFGGDIGSSVIQRCGREWYWSITDNSSTELLRLDDDAVVRARRDFAGRFQLVRPLVNGGLVQLYGSSASNTSPPRQLLTIDRDLRTLRLVEGDHPEGIAANGVLRLPDQSLLVFGYTTRPDRQGDQAAVSYVSSSLDAEQTWIFADLDYRDLGAVPGAVLLDGGAELVTARGVIARRTTRTVDPMLDRARFERGLTLDFLTLNPERGGSGK